MPIIETELWKISPDNPRALIFDSQRIAQDIFDELEAHLKADGRMPDEYFLFDTDWENGKLFPKDGEILCNTNYGGSEGIYIDIFVRHEKDVYEHKSDTGVLGWHKRMVTEHFATGKTLGDSIGDLDKMNLVASSVMAAFYGMKAEVQERYAKIGRGEEQPVYPRPPEKLSEPPITVTTIYGDVQAGDRVIATGNNDYAFLIGHVREITKAGTPEHNTETTNVTDAVHVDFTTFEYPPDRIEEIEERFSTLYGELKTFGELPLDDVIMAPDMLISISNLSQDEITFMGNLRENCEAFCNCFPTGDVSFDAPHSELMRRIQGNLLNYHDSLMGFGKRELIDMANKIAAMSDAYNYMSYRGFDDDELDFFLQFQNPLEVAAEGWLDYHADVDDEMGFAMDNILYNKQGWLDSYPLVNDSEAPADIGLRRFMGVDLIDFLGKISGKVIIHYPNDWRIDVDALYRAASSHDESEKRLIWHVCSMGTHLKQERNVFIRDSGAHEYMTDYHQNDADMFGYYVEVTGKDGQLITGNVFEVGNYADFARHLRLTALPLYSMTLTYTGDWGVNAGKTITVSRREYDDDRHRLMSESGNVYDLVPNARDEQELQKVLRDERVYRMSFPIGSMEEHLKNLDAKLAEIRKPPEELTAPAKNAEKTPLNKKRSITDQLAEAGEEAKAYNANRAQNPATTAKKHTKEID